MLGAAHAAANPLTAHHELAHGHAVGLLLPHVVRFNAQELSVRELYARLALEAGILDGGASPEAAATELANRLAHLLARTGLPETLDACGVQRAAIPMLADEAARQWTATFNPRPLAPTDFVDLYTSAFGAR